MTWLTITIWVCTFLICMTIEKSFIKLIGTVARELENIAIAIRDIKDN